MSSLRVYRIVVDEWPTPDGKPWARVYGYPHGLPGYDHLNGYEDANEEIAEWLEAVIENPTAHGDSWRVLDRVVYDTDRDLLLGVVMPKPNRKNYLSASGASELAKAMTAFGASVRVLRSNPVTWPEES